MFTAFDKNDIPTKSYAYSNLVDYKVREDGVTVTGSRAGSAAIGALLAGSAGAIVGGSMKKHSERVVKKLDIVLMLSDPDDPTLIISLISSETEKESSKYQEAIHCCDQIVSCLKQILKDSKRVEGAPRELPAKAIYAFSVADEILKFKQLMDSGIITLGEFERQKHKLFSLDY